MLAPAAREPLLRRPEPRNPGRGPPRAQEWHRDCWGLMSSPDNVPQPNMVAQRACGARGVAVLVLPDGSPVKFAVPDLAPAAGGGSGVFCRLLPGPTVEPDSSSAPLSLNGAGSTPFRKSLPPGLTYGAGHRAGMSPGCFLEHSLSFRVPRGLRHMQILTLARSASPPGRGPAGSGRALWPGRPNGFFASHSH